MAGPLSQLLNLYQKSDGNVKIVTSCVAAVTSYILVKACISIRARSKASQIFSKKRQEAAAEIEKAQLDLVKLDSKVSDKQEEEILKLPATELVQKLRSGKFSAQDVVKAYSRQALECAARYNCLAESCIAEAIEQAKLLDKEKKAVGPLHGLPISIKEHLCVKGKDAHMGISALCFKPAERDCLVVELLKDAGAVIHVTTNFPQILLSAESSNPVYGTTINPWNTNRTSGGSSGGEGALISGGGSVVGIGTDIGGSIRIPCANCGLFGLKPTSNRLSFYGASNPMPGFHLVDASLGPMGKNVDDLAMIMKALLVPKLWETDPYVPVLPFREGIYSSSKKLTVGVWRGSDYFLPCDSVIRAINTAADGLKKRGHTVVDFDLPEWETVLQTYIGLLMCDGMKTVRNLLQNDPVTPEVQHLCKLLSAPDAVKPVMSFLMSLAQGKRAVDFSNSFYSKTPTDVLKLTETRDNLRRALLQRWKEQKIDVLLCPVTPLPAHKLGANKDLHTASILYTTVWNLFDYPAGVVPITVVNEDELTYKQLHRDSYDRHAQIQLDGAVGLPVAVQLVATPFNEELCLNAMKEVATAVPFRHAPSK